MKIRLLILLLMLPSLALALPDAPTGLAYDDPSWTLDETLPLTIYDDGYEGWITDSFLGNYGSRNVWHDGPRLEVGGMRTPEGCVQGDGKMYCAFNHAAQFAKNIVEVDEATGIARLMMHWTGKYVGDIEECQGGSVFYGNDTLYMMGPNCVRKIVGDQVELVAGECGTDAHADGTGAAARFEDIWGWAVASDGNIYLISQSNLRKVTPAGVATTITLTRPAEGAGRKWVFVPGHFNLLSIGEDADTLYLADNWNVDLGKGIVRIDLTTNVMTRVAGIPVGGAYEATRAGYEADGPALTHVGFVGGARGLYVPFYDSFFLDANDGQWLHRLTTEDGEPWVKTFAGSIRPGTTEDTGFTTITSQTGGVSGEQHRLSELTGASVINHFSGKDDRGGIYFWHMIDANLIFRIYNPLEGGAQ